MYLDDAGQVEFRSSERHLMCVGPASYKHRTPTECNLRFVVNRRNYKIVLEGTHLKIWYPRQGSNLRPFAPEANALIH